MINDWWTNCLHSKMKLSSVPWYLLFWEDLVHLPSSAHPLSLIILLNLAIIPDCPSSRIFISSIPFSDYSSALGNGSQLQLLLEPSPTPDHHSFDLLTFPSSSHSPVSSPPSLSWLFRVSPLAYILCLLTLVPPSHLPAKFQLRQLRLTEARGKATAMLTGLTLNSWPLTSNRHLIALPGKFALKLFLRR